MLAETLQIQCSQRCELVLAMAYVFSRESVVAIAHRLANDREKSAIRLAQAMTGLNEKQGLKLALETLEEAGCLHGKETNITRVAH